MARITYYTNSFLASAVSILGSAMLAIGVLLLFSGEILVGLLLAAVGVVFLGVAKIISEQKAFNDWWKKVKKANLEPEIRNSRETAVEVYKKNPQKRTLDKIRMLNPAAAAYIESGYKESALTQIQSNSTPVYRPAQQPVQQPVIQQTVYQPPVQQSTYNPPVQQSTYQPPVMQQTAQPTYQPPVYQVSKTLDEQINEIVEIANGNLDKNDPEIHWQCAARFEELFRIHPESDRVRKNLAQTLANYAWNSTGKPFEERQRACAAILRAIAIENQDPGVAECDRRKITMIIHAVHGAIDASNTYNISAMEEAVQWLRTASEYKLANPNVEQQQYMNVAVPSARLYIGYWLAKDYIAANPANKQKARAVLEEGLQACSFALIRQCDLNPQRNTDLTTILTREQVLDLWKSTAN